MRISDIPTLVLITAVNLMAAVFYIDPQNGDISNNGSASSPWSTLQQVLDGNKIETRKYDSYPVSDTSILIIKNPGAPVKAGDTIMLLNGYHGAISAGEFYNVDYITIMAKPGHSPRVANLELRSCCKWIVHGLTISPSFATPHPNITLLQFSSHGWTGPSRDCIAEACTAYTVWDASQWTMQQWDTVSCDAVWVPGNKTIIRNCYFKNVNFGISVIGDSCLIENNIVENFAGDGLRGLGNYDTFQYNKVKNCYAVNANHDDGFQSWSIGDSGVGTGVVYGMVLRGNTIINYEDTNQPFRGTLQGIGCFDGMFEDWLVENNVVITDHWHGITLSGATNCKILNNTVVDINDTSPGPPWISIGDHKNGTLSTGCLVRNNLTTSLNISSAGVIQDHNIIVKNYNDYFVNYPKNDLHLKPGCNAIDSGSSDSAPAFDKDKNVRPFGARIDIGAYEWGYTSKIINLYTTHNTSLLSCIYNPHRETVTISAAGTNLKEITVFDTRGRVVLSIFNIHQNRIYINTKLLGSGVFIINAHAQTDQFSSRVVIQH